MHTDIEQLIIGWLPTIFTVRVLTETPGGDPPNDLATLLATTPVVRVVRIGGPTGLPGFDYPTVDFDCFALTRPAAKALAFQTQAAVEYRLPGYFNPYGTVLTAETISGPSWRPWDNTGLRRFGFTTRLAVHSRI